MYGGHWPQAGDRQAAALDRLIREADPTRASSTPRFRGIGTQGTGLAGVGYRVVGTAISGRETGGRGAEAVRARAAPTLAVADFRDLSGSNGLFHAGTPCDKAIPRLLDAREVIRSLTQAHGKLLSAALLVLPDCPVRGRFVDVASLPNGRSAPASRC